MESKVLSKANLISALESSLAQGQADWMKEELWGLLHELQVHELELEAQNRELRETQQALERSRDRFVDLYDFAPIGYMSLDRHGIIREINLTGASLLGYERAYLLDLPFIQHVAKPDLARFLRHLHACRQYGRAVTELTLLTKEGSELPARFDSRATAASEETGAYFLTAITDISEQRYTEELCKMHRELEQRTKELEIANQALREADQRKDEFLAMLGHELRNPLAPIRNAVRAMQRLNPSESRYEQMREMIDRQVTHLSRLVDDLLDISRITRNQVQLRRQLVELASIVAQATETVQPLMEARRHQFTVRLPPDPPVWLQADPSRLAQVIENLLANAAKYTPDGGQIELTAELSGPEVILRVADNGIGISPELLSRIFDLFAQADQGLDRQQGGLGIGLTLVKKLVELHGGRIEAHSEGPAQGSEFVVRLPLTG